MIENTPNQQDINGPMGEDVDVDSIANWFEFRMNNGDGTYQMFEQLCDVCVFVRSKEEKDGKKDRFHVRCMEEIPVAFVQTKFSHLPRITLQFVYGPNHHGPKVFEMGAVGATDGRYAEASTFLHPKMMFWKGDTEGKGQCISV